MKVLILIMSCREYAENGINQSLRDTWLQSSKQFPNLEYKIVMGDGTPVEETVAFRKSWNSRGSRYLEKPTSVVYQRYTPKDDELILPTLDDYKHLCFKTKAAHQWAFSQGFDFIFQSYADVYIDLYRLMGCGFASFRYRGGENGGGFWLSRESLKNTSQADVTAWNDDGWVRNVLKSCGVDLVVDPLYAATPNQPLSTNEFITSHLTISPDTHIPDKMYNAHHERTA